MPTSLAVRADLWKSWPKQSSGTTSQGHQEQSGRAERRSRLSPRSQEQADRLGCSREFYGEATGSDSRAEGQAEADNRNQSSGEGCINDHGTFHTSNVDIHDIRPGSDRCGEPFSDSWEEDPSSRFACRGSGVPSSRKFRSFVDCHYNSSGFSIPEPVKGHVYELEDGDLQENGDPDLQDMSPEDGDLKEEAYSQQIMKSLTQDERSDIFQNLNVSQETFETCLASFRRPEEPDQLDLMELCCEKDSLLCKTWEKSGRKAGRLGLHNGCDLSCEKGTQEAIRLVEKHKPKILWISFPCGATSPLQHFNELTEEDWVKSQKRKAKSRKLVKNGIRVINVHLCQGGEIVQEWPRYNDAWKFSCVIELWNALASIGRCQDVLLDGCMFGLNDGNGNLHRKPWRFRCSKPGMLNPLQRQCDGTHPHAPVIGGQLARRTALYSPELCRAVCHCLQSSLEDPRVFGAIEIQIDREGLSTLTDKELSKLGETALKLHRLCGHPGNRALVRTLAARGADGKLLAVAEQLKCQECQEGMLSKPSPKVTLEKEQVLWRTVQMDSFQMRRADRVHHFLLMLDEASGFSVVQEVRQHDEEDHENLTAHDVLTTLLRSWFQYFGTPVRLRCDPEGAFRGELLERFCKSRDIDLSFVPAEHHEATGDVERAVGELKKKIVAHLRNFAEDELEDAAYEMCAAHNRVARVSGYSPAQWAFGKDLGEPEGLATWNAAGDPSTLMHRNIQRRLDAEGLYRKMQAHAKISRALNAKPGKTTQYIPGDWVYYQRRQFPKDSVPHRELDTAKGSRWRWFGPAQVLATETRSSEDSLVRRPGNVVWIIAQGRLKRTHSSQLRHSSMREKLVAEANSAPTLPWTFSTLGRTLEKGQYEDIVKDLLPRARRERREPNPERSRSRGRGEALQQEMPEPPVPPQVQSEPNEADESEEELIPALPSTLPSEMRPPPAEEETPFLDVDRLLHDPQYLPLKRIPSEELEERQRAFRRARREHELNERPQHVTRETPVPTPVADAASMWMQEEDHNMVFSVIIPVPKDEKEWKKILKNPQKFVAKSVQKGAEVAWEKLNEDQKKSMSEAKMLEVDQWISQKVCEKFKGVVPRSRLMKTRWVLVLKAVDGDPSVVKCKARIVLLGYTDPDIEVLSTCAPTMSRRSRQLLLGFSSVRRWRLCKADAKSAFLQGRECQRGRDIFIMPVKELGDALGCTHGEAARMLKSAYGLVSAPRDWYAEVNDTITSVLGMKRLVTDPCVWICQHPVSKETIGYVASHVDDFMISGDSEEPHWQQTLERFKKAFQRSPWETTPFCHCGVNISQGADWSFTLDHHDFCEELMQITVETDVPEQTAKETSQARALLGAMQWRALQTAPQHSAKVSMLQSALPRGGKDVLHQINKLCREVHHQRFLSVSTRQLGASSVDDIGFVCFTDAAVGNRPDFASTGGHVVGMVHKDFIKGERGFFNPISWRSRKLARVARSSLSAEVQSLAGGEQELMYVRAEWGELLGKEINLLYPEATNQNIPAAVVVDAKSVYDCLHKGDVVSAGFSMKDRRSTQHLSWWQFLNTWFGKRQKCFGFLQKHS